jgi:hypothetical protein
VAINALALALGIGLGIAAAFLAEMTFTGLTTGDDIEARLGVRYLGAIPVLQSVSRGTSHSPASALLEDPRSAFAESFRSLRASIAMNTTDARIIAITSALPAEGKTTTAICLARSMASAGDRILLIDGDLRRQGQPLPARRRRAPRLDRSTPRLGHARRCHGRRSGDGARSCRSRPTRATGPELVTGDEMDRLLATRANASTR